MKEQESRFTILNSGFTVYTKEAADIVRATMRTSEGAVRATTSKGDQTRCRQCGYLMPRKTPIISLFDKFNAQAKPFCAFIHLDDCSRPGFVLSIEPFVGGTIIYRDRDGEIKQSIISYTEIKYTDRIEFNFADKE